MSRFEGKMRILSPTDGSKASHNALLVAADYADKFGSDLHILTVVPRITPMASPIEGFPHQYMMPDLDEIQRAYQRLLNHSEKEVKEKYPNLSVKKHMVVGRPSQLIVEKAEELDCDLVVMGSRGIGGITGWVLGSTSKKVVDQCKRKVLVVK